MATRQTTINRIARGIGKVTAQTCDSVPLDEFQNVVMANGGMIVDEAGEKVSAIFCGDEGRATFEIKFPTMKSLYIHITWYKREFSGRYEITANL